MRHPLERLWARVAPSDLGPVDFDRLARRPTPNDALAASPGALPPGAEPDLALDVYPGPATELIARVDDAVAASGEPVEIVDRGPLTRRYVTRSPTLRFPDTTVIEAVPLPGGGSGLRAYARASVGRADFGANRARLERWLAGIGKAGATGKGSDAP